MSFGRVAKPRNIVDNLFLQNLHSSACNNGFAMDYADIVISLEEARQTSSCKLIINKSHWFKLDKLSRPRAWLRSYPLILSDFF